jgi:hypothetical protein
MQPLQQIYIGGSSAGLQTNVKPFLLPDQAFQNLENAYVWRERVKKRQGLQLLGRLRRVLTVQSLGNSGASPWTFNIYSTLVPAITGEPNAQIQPGSVLVAIGLVTFQDNGDGTLTGSLPGNSGTINYSTGTVTLTTTQPAGTPSLINFNYYPSLPVMGITTQEIANVNEEQTIFFDTKYAYVYSSGFSEFISGTTWNGSDSDFFWFTNYRGVTPDIRLMFVTNFLNNASNPIRYTDGVTWTTFNPIIADNPPSAAQSRLYQALILIPYYGRLLALNTWEGTSAGGYAGASNFFNRCRFSQIGDPTDQVTGWRSDVFGRGGFIDAPTNEAIVSAIFYKNTLIVYFERSTWQLRYQGEYGLPFLWERISSDFGCDSTFSSVLFDDGVVTVGDKAITASSGVDVKRVDLQIPDLVFNFKNSNDGRERVQGIRDFQRELVFWTYVDSEASGANQYFPNKVLVYNYRNNTYAIFRENITAFGTFQNPTPVTWNSQDVTWNSQDYTWDDPDEQSLFPLIVSGNQQGYIHYYGYTTPDEPSLAIQGITFSPNDTTPVQLTIINHNLFQTDSSDPQNMPEIIYVTGSLFSGSDPGINNQIFAVQFVDENTISLAQWNGTAYQDYINQSVSTYIGGGQVTLFPRLNVITKDFNPYQNKGIQTKISYIDFLTDATVGSSMSVNLFMNSSLAVKANLLVGNQAVETYLNNNGLITAATNANPCQITSPDHALQNGTTIIINSVGGMTQLNGNTYTVSIVDNNNFTIDVDSTAFGVYTSGGKWNALSSPFYVPESNIAWHRFFATATGQFLSIQMTYDDELMNDLDTHRETWVLNAFTLYVRPGGKTIF